MSKLELYLLTRMDSVNALFVTITILGVIAVSVLLIIMHVMADSEYDNDEKARKMQLVKRIPRYYIIPLSTSLIMVAIPTTKDLAIIYGLHYVTNSKEAQKLPDNILKTINTKLEEIQKSENTK